MLCWWTNWALEGTIPGMTGSSKTGRWNVARSRTWRVVLTFGDGAASSRIFLTNTATDGPMRTARVEPMMIAIFFSGRGRVGSSDEAIFCVIFLDLMRLERAIRDCEMRSIILCPEGIRKCRRLYPRSK